MIKKRTNLKQEYQKQIENQIKPTPPKSFYWLERELEKKKNPTIKEKEKKCKDCKRKAKIKIEFKNKKINYYCVKHGINKYKENENEINNIEKKEWFKK